MARSVRNADNRRVPSRHATTTSKSRKSQIAQWCEPSRIPVPTEFRHRRNRNLDPLWRRLRQVWEMAAQPWHLIWLLRNLLRQVPRTESASRRHSPPATETKMFRDARGCLQRRARTQTYLLFTICTCKLPQGLLSWSDLAWMSSVTARRIPVRTPWICPSDRIT